MTPVRPPTSAACPLCGAPGSTAVVRAGEHVYRACDLCLTARLDPMPAPERLTSLYDRVYFEGGGHGGYVDYAGDEALHRRNARDRVALLRRFASTPGRLVDVGCALGFFLDEARAAGWSPVGVELSPWCAERARAQLGLEVHARLDELAASRPGSFDVVSFFQVLEHLPDPRAALVLARTCLRPGGLIVIETWDRASAVARWLGARWHQVNPPSVLFHFHRGGLPVVLDQVGCGTLWNGSTTKRVSVEFVTGLLADRGPRVLGDLHRRWGRGAAGRLAVPYRLGDLVTIVARADQSPRRT